MCHNADPGAVTFRHGGVDTGGDVAMTVAYVVVLLLASSLEGELAIAWVWLGVLLDLLSCCLSCFMSKMPQG